MILGVMEIGQISGGTDRLESILPWVSVTVILLMFVKSRWGYRRIRRPVVGFLNLAGPSAADFLEEDLTALGQVFPVATSFGDGPVGRCDVLFLYTRIDAAGATSLVQLLAAAGSAIVIFALPGEAENYRKLPAKDLKQSNFVFALDRKGNAFPRFFRMMFSEMMAGKTLMAAWKKVAPQNPQADHQYFPETYGQIHFKIGFK